MLAFVMACVLWILSASSKNLQPNGTGATSQPGWISALFVGWLLAPFLTCLFLLFSQGDKSIARGAGLACGLFGAFLFASPYALVAIFLALGFGGPSHQWGAAGLGLLLMMAISVWIVWWGWKIGKIHRKAFGTAMGLTLVYLFVGFQFFRFGDLWARRRGEMELYLPATLARQRLVALSACLIRNHMLHPDAGFPTSLDPAPTNWNCNAKFAVDAVTEFTFGYFPVTDETGQVVDFELTAVPREKGVRNRVPLMTDKRGIVFVYTQWEIENGGPPRIIIFPSDQTESQIDWIRGNVRSYMKNKSGGAAPAALTEELVGAVNPDLQDGGMRLETRDFQIRYFAAKAEDRSGFALSSRCKSYGVNCLRSYYLDYHGVIHATGEPRDATAEDFSVLRCELIQSVCEDMEWPVH